jgi:hypothetical protein
MAVAVVLWTMQQKKTEKEGTPQYSPTAIEDVERNLQQI